MLGYDAENFEPPAPVAYVTLRNPATGVLLSDVPLLIDTGADATLLPLNAVEQLGIAPEDADFEVQVFDGEIKRLKLAKLELYFLDKKLQENICSSIAPLGFWEGIFCRMFASNWMARAESGTR